VSSLTPRHTGLYFPLVPLAIPDPRDSGYTQSTPVPLYWASYGVLGAPRVLVLHGGPGADHRYMLPQMLRLADRYDLLFYDQRGGGKSRTDAHDVITWRTQVADLGAVVREFGLALPAIIGYSWGGLLAMLYVAESLTDATLRSPGRLALIDPAAVTREYRAAFEAEFKRRGESELVRAARASLTASGLRESDPEAYRRRTFELSVAGYFADPTRMTQLTAFRVVGRVQRSVWDSLNDYDLLPALARVRARLGMPTLVVHGREDPIPLASSAAVADALGAELVVIDGSGHVPYVERPEILFSTLERFLAPVQPMAPDVGAIPRPSQASRS
jgi:proline iminopeptidase